MEVMSIQEYRSDSDSEHLLEFIVGSSMVVYQLEAVRRISVAPSCHPPFEREHFASLRAEIITKCPVPKNYSNLKIIQYYSN
jgi:hypothetical protein